MSGRAKLIYGLDDLHAALQLPRDCRLVHVETEYDPHRVIVHVESASVAPTPPDCESPVVRLVLDSAIAARTWRTARRVSDEELRMGQAKVPDVAGRDIGPRRVHDNPQA